MSQECYEGRSYFMGKLLSKTLALGIISSLAVTVPVFARGQDAAVAYQSQLETVYNEKAHSLDSTKGAYINFSNSSVTNAGGGAIGISAATTAHEPVDKIRIHLYLDRLDTDNRWTQVDDFDFTFTPEDDPSGELTIAAVEFEVNNQPSGYYYRVRGTHGVWKNGAIETQSTRTDGVMITDTP